jgi:short-subunit dehydrogenase
MNIVITGASSGIGFELAKHLSISGHNVLAIARNLKQLNQLKEYAVFVYGVDINTLDESQWSSIIKHLKWDKIDGLVNNAGVLIHKPFLELSDQDWHEIYNTNVIASARLIRLAIPYMQTSNLKHIINISSMGGVGGTTKFPGLSAYSSSKGAVSILTECLAEEFREFGLSVNALALGSVQTPMLELAFPNYQAAQTPQSMATFMGWFLLNGNQWFNGKVLPVSKSIP